MASEVGSVPALIAWQNVLNHCCPTLYVCAPDISCEAIVEKALSFELEVTSVGWSWGKSTPQVTLVGES